MEYRLGDICRFQSGGTPAKGNPEYLLFAMLGLGVIYPDTLLVTDTQNNIITMETATGYVYQVEGVEDIMDGDLLSVLFYDNGTEVITDDIIIDFQYSGYVK